MSYRLVPWVPEVRPKAEDTSGEATRENPGAELLDLRLLFVRVTF